MQKSIRPSARIIGRILFATLLLSMVYALIRFVVAPSVAPADQIHVHVKSDYILMLTQCLLGLLVLSLPSLLSKKWHWDIPNAIYILYYVFLFCAIFLGEVLNFYYLIPHWDTILHFFSGAMLGALGFILVQQLNDSAMIHVSLSPGFVALFAFSFGLAAGAVWEIYEFTFDSLLGLNMQKFATETGQALTGQAALRDTMKDLVIDSLATLLITLCGYVRMKRRRDRQPQADAASPTAINM